MKKLIDILLESDVKVTRADDCIWIDEENGSSIHLIPQQAISLIKQLKNILSEQEQSKGKIIYARGFPYGAPLVLLRGKGTIQIKDWLKKNNFIWDSDLYAWKNYLDKEDFKKTLLQIKEMGYEIIPKKDMEKSYVINLEEQPITMRKEPSVFQQKHMYRS